MELSRYFKINTKNGRAYWSTTTIFDNLSNNEKQSVYQYFESFNKAENANSADKVFRSIARNESVDFTSPKFERRTNLLDSVRYGEQFYNSLQTADGNWAGDYGGPMFLLPGLIIASYITESPFDNWQQELMKRYIINHQNEDGGWGLHIEGASTMFGTVMNYIALRLLGLNPTEEQIILGKKWIKDNGGATLLPSWGKFYLSILGVYEWEGNTSLFPETWLLPDWFPLHPSKFWCHTRMVYLPMAYCYGVRLKANENELINALKTELYPTDYKQIKWKEQRTAISDTDLFFPMTKWAKAFNKIADIYESFRIKKLRKHALTFILNYINAEDQQTNYINIGPVNQVINSLAIFHAYGKGSEQFKAHRDRWKDYLWLAEDGLKMQGYNGSQMWDTSFYLHALIEDTVTKENKEILKRAHDFIDYSQIKEENCDEEKWYRHSGIGGWPFSTLEHGWPITDCTALGLSAAVEVHILKNKDIKSIGIARMQQAADVIISYQNSDGSWSTYEKQRASQLLEKLNPSEIFGEIMVDFPHIECSSSSIQGLLQFQKVDTNYRSSEITKAINRGVQYILSEQEENGGWYGNWGVCYTYGTWFALEMLNKLPASLETTAAIEKACTFLKEQVHPKDGWGETYESCVKKSYVQHNEPQVINTAWAVLALLASGKKDWECVEKGISVLQEHQLENGDFPQQSISGVFNQNCMITYTAYRNVFPIWAMKRWLKIVANKKK